MSLPFFDRLRRCFPDSPVDIIAKDNIQDTFQNHPDIRTIHSFSKAHVHGWRGLLAYGRALQRSGPYHLFITLSPSFSSALIGIGVGSPVRVGYRTEGRAVLLTHHFRQERGIHRVQAYCQLLAHLEASVRQRRQSSFLRFAERALVDEAVPSVVFPFTEAEQQIAVLPKPPQVTDIVFNVNSEAQSRRLPLSTWVALGQRLLSDAEQKFRLIFIGTSSEQPRVAEVMQGIGSSDRLLDFSGKTTLRELAILLRDADVVVTNDSGPMHLANAVGTPVVTFFGAGDPAVTRPFNADRTILLNAHAICSPCVKNICRFPRVACLEAISAEEIYQSILKLSVANRTPGALKI